MKDFMLIYLGGDPNWAQNSTPEEMKAVMESWGKWGEEMKTADRLRSMGAGLTPEGAFVTKDGADVKTDSAMIELKELVGGYSVVIAKDLAEANALAAGTPFLRNNPGGTVLVRACHG